MRTFPLLLTALFAALGAACDAASSSGDGGGAAPTFDAVYTQVLSASCVTGNGCHSDTSRSGFLSFGSRETAYDELMNVEAMGSTCRNGSWLRVVPGDPDASLLVAKLEGTSGCGSRMPSADSPLPDERIEQVRAWIAAGARDD